MRRLCVIALSVALATACMKMTGIDVEPIGSTSRGLFITCEGNFMYGNASLSYYDMETRKVENRVFRRANGADLGDVAQSMTIYDGRGYVVVNNSGIVFVIDPDTFVVTATIEGLTSPRYIHFVNREKGYITDLYDPRIAIFDPRTNAVTGYIDTGSHPSTEQMVQWGDYVFTNCWSYDNKILVIDTRTDTVVDEIEVGIQPTSLVLDCNDKLWSITDGGYAASPYGHEAPSLCRIDPATRRVERRFTFAEGDSPSELAISGDGSRIYFINDDIWQMEVTAENLPARPLVANVGTIYYGLAVDPATGDVYVADAIDYQQPGVVYRYSAAGEAIDRFEVGIIPGAFCFKSL